MRRFWAAVLTCLAGACGCRPSSDTSESSTAVAVPTQDASLESATERARTSVADFQKALATPTAEQSDFSVKVEVRDDDVVHYIWLQKVTGDGSTFTGMLGPDASGLKNHKPGDTVTVAVDQISDWMYIEDKKLVGGFTLRAIRDSLRGPQRKAFEKSMWFEF